MTKEWFTLVTQELFNPKKEHKKEIKVGEVIYRVNDKVLQLTNSVEDNVYNGDIGYIKEIKTVTEPRKKDVFVIDFDGNKVEYGKEDLIIQKKD